MSEDWISKAVPSSGALSRLVQYEFAVAFASFGLWTDVAVAWFWHGNILNIHLRWGDGVPIGAATVVLITYGLIYVVARRRVLGDLQHLWRVAGEFVCSRVPRLRKRPLWFPDASKGDFTIWEIELRAAKAGNSVLMGYVRDYRKDIIVEYETQSHLFLIGIFLVVEVLLPGTLGDQIAQGAFSSWSTEFRWLVGVSGVGTIILACKPSSGNDVYIRLPRDAA